MVSIPFLHRGVFRDEWIHYDFGDGTTFQSPFFIGASSGVAGLLIVPACMFVSIPFLHRGVFRGLVLTAFNEPGSCFNPLSSSGRLQGRRGGA